MRSHRNPQQRLPKQSSPDNRRRLKLPAPPPEPEPEPDELGNLLYVLNDQLRRSDAFTTSAEKELVESWGLEGDEDEDEDGGVQRRRMRVEYLVEAAKLEVRAAQYTGDQIAAELAKRGGGA